MSEEAMPNVKTREPFSDMGLRPVKVSPEQVPVLDGPALAAFDDPMIQYVVVAEVNGTCRIAWWDGLAAYYIEDGDTYATATEAREVAAAFRVFINGDLLDAIESLGPKEESSASERLALLPRVLVHRELETRAAAIRLRKALEAEDGVEVQRRASVLIDCALAPFGPTPSQAFRAATWSRVRLEGSDAPTPLNPNVLG